MPSPITTAVIAVAGWGTRWLPLTKSIEKCMLPIGTRPVVDWAVADCVQAGINRIIFIIGEEHDQIQQYYSHHASLESYLSAAGKAKYLDAVRQPQYKGVTFEYRVQPAGNYGTAIPAVIAAAAIRPDDAFVFVNGDDFIYRPDGGSEVADFCQGWYESGAAASLMAREVPRADASKYGLILRNEAGDFTGIHEKPDESELGDASHFYINRGAYIVSPDLRRLAQEYVAKASPNKDGEYYITDVFGQAATNGLRIHVHDVKGEHLDAGTPANWLAANQRVAS